MKKSGNFFRLPTISLPTLSNSRSHIEGRLQPGSTFCWKAGDTAIQSTLQAMALYCRLTWTGKAIGTGAIHVWMLEPRWCPS